MLFKKVNLFLYPVLVIVLFFTIPFYNQWLYGRVLSNNFLFEIKHLDPEARKIQRYGYSYTVYEDITGALKHRKNVTLLLPPTNYVKARKLTDLSMPEPAVFYYFTGIRAVWPNSREAATANWVFVVDSRGSMNLIKMELIRNQDSLINDYKRYIK